MKIKRKNNQKLTSEKIIQYAIELADRDGFEKLSMRKLAASLDIEAMSLYHYFSSKKELVSGMVDSLIPVLEAPDCVPDWQAAMRRRAHELRSLFLVHPWLPHQLISGINTSPAMLAYTDTTIGYLVNAGFSVQEADYAWSAIDSYIYGFNLQTQNFPLHPSEYQAAAQQYIPTLSQSQYPHLYAMGLEVAEGKHDGIPDFDFGLNLLLGALEEMRARSSNT